MQVNFIFLEISDQLQIKYSCTKKAILIPSQCYYKHNYLPSSSLVWFSGLRFASATISCPAATHSTRLKQLSWTGLYRYPAPTHSARLKQLSLVYIQISCSYILYLVEAAVLGLYTDILLLYILLGWNSCPRFIYRYPAPIYYTRLKQLS